MSEDESDQRSELILNWVVKIMALVRLIHKGYLKKKDFLRWFYGNHTIYIYSWMVRLESDAMIKSASHCTDDRGFWWWRLWFTFFSTSRGTKSRFLYNIKQ